MPARRVGFTRSWHHNPLVVCASWCALRSSTGSATIHTGCRPRYSRGTDWAAPGSLAPPAYLAISSRIGSMGKPKNSGGEASFNGGLIPEIAGERPAAPQPPAAPEVALGPKSAVATYPAPGQKVTRVKLQAVPSKKFKTGAGTSSHPLFVPPPRSSSVVEGGLSSTFLCPSGPLLAVSIRVIAVTHNYVTTLLFHVLGVQLRSRSSRSARMAASKG